MDQDPIWTRCLHLSAGTCPQLMLQSAPLAGQNTPRPELTQDLALARLSEACLTCHLAPPPPGSDA